MPVGATVTVNKGNIKGKIGITANFGNAIIRGGSIEGTDTAIDVSDSNLTLSGSPKFSGGKADISLSSTDKIKFDGKLETTEPIKIDVALKNQAFTIGAGENGVKAEQFEYAGSDDYEVQKVGSELWLVPKGAHVHEDETIFLPWDGTIKLTAGNYYLADNVELKDIGSQNITGDVTLCLNGKTLSCVIAGYNVFGTLTICDCSAGEIGKIIDLSIGVMRDGHFTLKSGQIISTKNQMYALHLEGDGFATIAGGTVKGYGGIDGLYDSTITITGGNITGTDREGIITYGKLIISGGTIKSENTRAIYTLSDELQLSNDPVIEGSNVDIYLYANSILIDQPLTGGPYVIDGVADRTFATGDGAAASIDRFKLTDDLINASYEIAIDGDALVARLKTYTIKYESGEGSDISGKLFTETKTHGKNITISDKKFTRPGYTQIGWSTEQGASEVKYAFGADYTENANLTLYPVWEQNEIHFYKDGVEIHNLSLKVGESAEISVKITPENAVCGTVQWTAQSGISIDSGTGYTVTVKGDSAGKFELKATTDGGQTAKTLTVNVTRFNSTVTAENKTVTYGENVTITATVEKAATNGISLMSLYDNKVTFKLGDKSLGEVEVKNGEATLTIPATRANGFAIGENTVTLEYSGSGALENVEGSVTVTVKPKTLTATITGTTAKTYDGTASADDLGLELKLTGVVDDDDVTATAEFAYDSASAGERKISAEKAALTGEHAGYYELSAPIPTVSGKISPLAVELVWEGDEFVYDGTSHEVTAAVENVVGDDEIKLTYTENTATNAGKYTAKVTDLGNENYTLTGATGIEHKWKITALSLANAQIEIVGSYTYNGEIQTPEFIVTLGGKVLSADKDYTVTYSGDVIDAGKYTVTLTGTGNYSGNASAEFEIAPKSLTANISGTLNKVYDGTANVSNDVKIALTGVVEGDIVTATAEISYDSENAGVRKIVAKNIGLSGEDAKNYTLSSNQTEISGSIAPAPITLSNTEFIYGGETTTVIQVSGMNETVTATLTAFSSDAGEYEYSETAKENSYTVELSSENYAVSKAGTLTIKPLVAVLEWQGGEFTYDGKSHSVTATVKNAVVGDEFEIEYTGNAATEAGDYTAKVTDLGNANYALNNPDALQWSILPAVAEFTWVGDTFAYDGQEHSVSAEIKKVAENDEFALTYNNEKSSKIGTYTAEVVSLGNSNYTLDGSTSKTHAWSIHKSDLTVATLPAAADITYGQSLSDSALTGGVVMNGKIAVSGSFAWVDSDETPAVKDSGKSFAVVFTPDDSSYDPVETEVTITVNKAVLTPKIGKIDNKVYDGNTAATGVITLTGAKLDDMPTAAAKFNFVDKNAGKNKSVNVSDITLAGSWSDNYKLSTESLLNQSTNAEILPRAAEIEWVGNEFTYDGEAHTVTATVKNAVAGDKFEIAYTGNAATNAGDYTAKVTALGNANYTFEGAIEHKWKITPRVAEIEWVGNEFTYDGNSHTVTATVKNAVAGDKFEIAYTGNAATKVGDYTAKVTALGNANYTLNGATGVEHKWKITTLSLADAQVEIVGTYTYNGEVQTPEIRVTLGGKELLSGKDYTLEYSGEVKDADTYTVTLTGMGNYSGSASAEFEIAPKSLTASISGILSKVYDGTANVSNDVKIALSGIVKDDDVTATADFSYDSANADARKIAANNITLGGDDSKNYTLSSTQAEISGSIAPAPITLSNTEFIYGGETTTVIQVSGMNETVTATLTAFSSDAGEYEYSETAKENSYTVELSSENYAVSKAGTLTIKPLVAVLEWQSGEFTYDGNAHEVTATVKNAVSGDKFEIEYTDNTATAAGDYTAKVTTLGNVNYILSGANEYKWTIVPRVAEIEWTGDEFTYDGNSHEVTATVKNAVAGDKFSITYTCNTATVAGDYTAKVTALGNVNYILSGANEYEWTIAPRVAEIEWVGDEFTYDGKSHTVTAAVKNAVAGDKFEIA